MDSYKKLFETGEIVAFCTSPNGECPGVDGDMWCIIDGRICHYFMIGIKKKPKKEEVDKNVSRRI